VHINLYTTVHKSTSKLRAKMVLRGSYLEEDLNAIDEKEDDDDEHEEGVAAVEDVGVELAVLVFDPDL